MKNRKLLTGMIAAVGILSLAACTPAADAPVVVDVPVEAADEPASPETIGVDLTDVMTVDDEGVSSVDDMALAVAVDSYPAGELSADEMAGLLYMREEEKLAHDVYITLYDIWGIPIFQNISASEQTHTDAVKTLLDRYGLEDPTIGNAVGVFTDQTLQGLYNDLVALGSESLGDALKVGAAIEEIDILDLEERIAQTNNADIILVYDNLMKGSRNHLRAFVSTLATQTGEDYVPQYMDQVSYDAVMSEAIERGGPGQGNGRGGNG